MRVLVCGGRGFPDAAFLNSELDRLHAIHHFKVLIEGCARGADHLAGLWANASDVERLKFPADWKGLGHRAGYIRNLQMLRKGNPNLVIAFPGGKGTAHITRIARGANIPVLALSGRGN